jgi:endosialidase-like protein
MKKIYSLHAVLCMVFVVACLSTSALGQSAEDKNPLTSMTSSGSSVRWEVAGPYSSLVMTVGAPDGRVFRKEFKGGSSPEFSVEQNGERLPDGEYTYELRLSPVISSAVKEELAKLRASEYASEPAREASKVGAMSESLVLKTDSADAIRAMRKAGLLPAEPTVKSGAFTIQNGMAIMAGTPEGSEPQPTKGEPRPMKRVTEVSRLSSVPPNSGLPKVKQHHLVLNALPDEVINDDLIVQGSACIGLDCVNNENFGFDTIRLKENNTRIKFDDTSVSAGFPANDWQLTANDSASGGASKFSIEDITGAKVPFTIRAGAATNSIFVDSTGRIGNRTSTPVLDIHVNTSNTPAIRLEQNNSGGFTAQTWDIGANEANFFVRDVTSGSRLPFRIRPGAPTSSLDISADGDVGVGTASPEMRLDVKVANTTTDFNNNTTYAAAMGNISGKRVTIGYDETDQDAGLIQSVHTGVGFKILGINPNGGNVGIGTVAPTLALSVSGDANKSVGGGSWQVFSDERLKNIKGNFTSGLKAVMQLQPLRYQYKKDNALGLKSEKEQIGFGASALQKVIPEAVSTNAGYLQVNNDPIIWTMLNAIKEQQKEIEQLRGEVRKLRARSHRRR